MEVNGPGSVQGPDPIRPGRISSGRFAAPASEPADPDRVEISELARLKALLKDVPELRLEKIERIRAEIDAGTYETAEKIQTVIDRLLEEL
jgi:anti-sigma28 factor (negative regulator of flagellin synthesis)